MSEIKSLSVRIENEMLEKLHIIADYEGRSANAQILVLIRNCIQQYEKEHGTIDLKDPNLRSILPKKK